MSKRHPKTTRGQTLVEVSIAILLGAIILGGVLRVAPMLDTYLVVVDGARLGARVGAQLGGAAALNSRIVPAVTALFAARGIPSPAPGDVTATDVQDPGMPLDVRVTVRHVYEIYAGQTVDLGYTVRFPRAP